MGNLNDFDLDIKVKTPSAKQSVEPASGNSLRTNCITHQCASSLIKCFITKYCK